MVAVADVKKMMTPEDFAGRYVESLLTCVRAFERRHGHAALTSADGGKPNDRAVEWVMGALAGGGRLRAVDEEDEEDEDDVLVNTPPTLPPHTPTSIAFGPFARALVGQLCVLHRELSAANAELQYHRLVSSPPIGPWGFRPPMPMPMPRTTEGVQQ